MKMVIHVSKDSTGRHWAIRSFESMGADHAPKGNVFSLTQEDNENVATFEQRVRDEAARRKLGYIERLSIE